MTLPFAGLLAATLAVACAPSEQGIVQGRPNDPVISLSEGPCPDTCPVYDMTLHPDGAYTLNGQRFVKTEGVSEGALGKEAWDNSVRVLEEAGFWKLKPEQTPDTLANCQPDTPVILITWRDAEGREKTVKYDAGCGVEKMKGLISNLRETLAFDYLVWTNDRFNPETGSR